MAFQPLLSPRAGWPPAYVEGNFGAR